MKSAIFGSAMLSLQALVAGPAWASDGGGGAARAAGAIPSAGIDATTVATVAGVAALVLLVGGIAVFRSSKSDSPFESGGPATRP